MRDNVGPLFRLAEAPGGPWPEWVLAACLAAAEEGEAEEPAGVAKLMRGFGVKPVNLRTGAGDVAKGYRLEDLEKALAPYTPSANPLHRSIVGNKGNNADPIRHMRTACGGCEGQNTVTNQASSVAADMRGGSARRGLRRQDPGPHLSRRPPR